MAALDVHAHILPGMDDGSGSVEESLTLLRSSAAQGVGRMAATPHFDPQELGPKAFLARREAAAESLRAAWEPGLPELLLGAEVSYFEGVSRTAELDALRIEGSELLLLEMPFRAWPERLVREVADINRRQGLTVLLAHVERYLWYQKPEAWDTLLQAGILCQCNAGFFLDLRTRRRALRLLKEGKVHFLASDCHNPRSQPPRLGEALAGLDAAGRELLEGYTERYFSTEG